MGTEEEGEEMERELTRKPGGWYAIKYILGNESFEKLASMSLVSNIAVYLHTKYNLSGVVLVNIVTIWNGSCNLTSLAGAIISDAYIGRFLTLLFGSFASFLGMGMITLTAAVSHLRPPPCNGHSECVKPQFSQIGFLFLGLGLLSIGAGGIRPCNIAFGADQLDINTEKGRKQLESFFNWWYLSFTLALVIALTGVVYIQTNVSWAVGFAIPTACLASSILIFLLGKHSYVYMKPNGSVFVDMVKVVIAAFRKRKETLGGGSLFFDPPQEDKQTMLPRTERFMCLDKAALILNHNEANQHDFLINSWDLCSLQKVEQLKCVIGILPVWISGITCFVVMDQQSTFGILQAIQMNRTVGTMHFQIPPAWLGITSMIALSIWILLYEQIYTPIAKRMSSKNTRMSMRMRIQTGIVMSTSCMFVAGIVERSRRDSALQSGILASPMSVVWLVPQFVLSGLTEAFAAVAIMEFLTMQMPENMRTVAGAIFFFSMSVSNYASTLIVNFIHVLSGGHGKSPWLGGHDLNKNRLDFYYYILAALGALNFLYFNLFASHFMRHEQPVKITEDLELQNPRVVGEDGDDN